MLYRAALCFMMMFSIFPKDTYSHASLVAADPSPDSEWISSPPEIHLTFSERIDQGLYYLKVFDDKGNEVAGNEASVSEDRMVLRLSLPTLANGVYTVSYRIISEDSHPVRGTYIIFVGIPRSNADHSVSNPSSTRGFSESIIYAANGIYLLSYLLLIGWIGWGTVFRPFTAVDELRKGYLLGTQVMQQIHLMSLILLMLLLSRDIISSLKGTEELKLPLGSLYGVTWMALLLLSITGFFTLLRSKVWDRIWVVLMVGVKSLSGHAITLGPPLVTVPLNAIHLLAAGVWVGGLLLIVMNWRRHQLYMRVFIALFSRTAMICIALLSVSGIVSAEMFLPKLRYVLETPWGLLIGIKLALILGVAVIGAVLNVSVRHSRFMNISTWLKCEIGLMVVIVMVVGVLVHQKPTPENKPLLWEDEWNQAHMSAQIVPNIPGIKNRFIVDIAVSDPDAEPKNIEMRLYPRSHPEIAPIRVPLSYEAHDDGVNIYSTEGAYVPFPGRWTVEIRIQDKEDNEQVYRRQIEVFAP
ncbi:MULTISPECIES: copper resistance protein CopC [unclassified Paenibacillus]|uniref:copper resistance CopC/CopD family protein n=1 Tax=unclassified Paenibacillus TaxID=185978 RepID=UPI001AE80E34|nr:MULTISPECIES: copper resistance protein CopC [unclassified Paenibacillus]MBP1155880.1 copper transport protein [Paenibacillus sp. PvP091]MBP1168734.1 copper transport protein [Paenibacillus sp. PvR098]MBP2439762.1 copper transport protein [Paenibacillus sp. PvP052]